MAEPVQIGTVTRSEAGCALEIVAEPIPAGAGRLTVVNETNRRVAFDLLRFYPEVLTFGEFEAFIASGEPYLWRRLPFGRSLPDGAFGLVQREVGPGASGTITDNFWHGGTYAIACGEPLSGFGGVNLRPIALVGPIEVETAPAETGPAETGPAGSLDPEHAGPDPALSKVNVINLPPEGAPPSSPEHGELVLYVGGRGVAADRALTNMYLYADGRLIWWREGDLPAGATGHDILEQRLTPEGVELMRSEMIASGLFDRGIGVLMGGEADPDPMAFWGGMGVRDGERFVERQLGWVYVKGDTIMTAEQEHALKVLDARLADPASWLPASAWADQEIKVYVPTTYRVCYGGTTETVERDRLLHAIPGPVQGLLEARDAENEPFNEYVSFGDWVNGVRVTRYCSELTTEEARDVVRGLDDGGFEREQSPTYANSIQPHARSTFEYFSSVPDLVGRAALWIDPNLPHGAGCMMC